MATSKAQRKPARITGRKLAKTASRRVRRVYGLDPQHGVRWAVASMSAQNQDDLMGVAETLREGWPSAWSWNVVQELRLIGERQMEAAAAQPTMVSAAKLRGALRNCLEDAYQQTVAGLVLVQRIEAPRRGSYPLRRTHVITLNLERYQVVAEIRELTPLLELRGFGFEPESAIQDLAIKFIQLVEEKVRVPPHELSSKGSHIVAVLNYMIDWEQWRHENQPPSPLWGQIIEHCDDKGVRVKWLLGPGGVRDVESVVHHGEVHPGLFRIPQGRWFHAVVRELPDDTVWLEPPCETPDPTDLDTRERAWREIPEIAADEPDVWPLEDDDYMRNLN